MSMTDEVAQQEAAQQAPDATAWLHLPHHWPAQADVLFGCQHLATGFAMLLILTGLVYMLFGSKIYQWLVLLNAAAMGAAAGAVIGEHNHLAVPLGVAGAFIAIAVTWPMMKWAVAMMGALFGAVLGASLWRLFGLEPQFAWAGGLTGLVGLGLLSFILFHGCVVMYTSLQGSVMLILGVLALIFKSQDVSPSVTQHMLVRPFLLPMAIFVPTIVGIIYQQNVARALEQKG